MTEFAHLSVLVVEDHAFQRRTILRMLANMGVGSVTEAEDGESALAMLGAGSQPDVILTDLDLPGVDGIALLCRIAETRPGQAVVIASGLTDDVLDAARVTGERHGLSVLGTIRKPLNAARIQATIAGVTRDPTAAATDGAGAVRLEPQVDLRDGRCTGIAVLQSGIAVDELVAIGCRVHRELLRAGSDACVSVALPGESLGPSDLPELLVARAALEGVVPRRLTLAVSADAVIAAGDRGFELLARLRLRGFGVALVAERAASVHAELPHTELALALGPDTWSPLIAAARAAGTTVTAIRCDDAAAVDAAGTLGCDRAQGAAVGVLAGVESLPDWLSART